MCEAWTRGTHANVSGHALDVLREKMLFSGMASATSYASIFGEKDYIRS